MKTHPAPGDTVSYEIDGKQVIAKVIEVYEKGDIRTDQDGVRTKNEYKLRKNSEVMKTEDLSAIMRMAWRFFRITGQAFGECLRKAWANYKLVQRMHRGIVKFYFQKVDGSTREAWGTLCEKLIPPTKGDEHRKKNDTVQVYFDTEVEEFRCFKKLNLV